MRWFVEVSQVGDSAPAVRYCLEAKAWQAALQEARKLRGDSGPLSKFSIELLEEGYRAIDPIQKLSYLVNQAPADAPLEPPLSSPANGTPSEAPPPPSPAIVPSPSIVPSRSIVPNPTSIVPSPLIIPNPSSAPQAPKNGEPGAVATLSKPAPPRPQASPSLGAKLPEPAPARSEPLFASFELLRRRAEEPSPKVPMSYREEAYVVPSGTERVIVEVLLRDRLAELQDELTTRPSGKLVQLAIFDHHFPDKPLRPPLGTLTWKDWRGEPVLGFPAFSLSPPSQSPLSQSPPRAPLDAAPKESSAAPAPVTGSPSPQWPPAHTSFPPPLASSSPVNGHGSAALQAAPEAPPPVEQAELIITEPEVVGSEPDSEAEGAPPRAAELEGARPLATELRSEAVETPPPIPFVAPVVAPLVAPSVLPLAARPSSDRPSQPIRLTPTPSAPRSSRPKLIVPRRRAGEDLIAELFEVMHELHFAQDIVGGAEFVAGALTDYIPSDVQLIQVFDIDQRKFVVVRAHGQGAEETLLHATPDTDPKIVEIMRRPHPRVELFDGKKVGRFAPLKEEFSDLLVGPVHQGGRYLGLIELANPLGGDPFHPTEINALDYICAQFAEFLASRPIVLDPELILGR